MGYGRYFYLTFPEIWYIIFNRRKRCRCCGGKLERKLYSYRSDLKTLKDEGKHTRQPGKLFNMPNNSTIDVYRYKYVCKECGNEYTLEQLMGNE